MAAATTTTAAKAPFIPQDVSEVATMVKGLEAGRKSGGDKKHFKVKKNTFDVVGSSDGIQVDSWKFSDWDYKRRDLPTYARGLFTTRNRRNEPQIAVRGYDKFFNISEVHETEWKNIIEQTRGPYELTLKENGCIIFISGLEDGTLLVCSKHSTGERGDVDVSHAKAGEQHIEKQLAAIGKTKADLAAELYRRNVTAVAELCDDSFEEHILAYGEDKAGLYLHGVNLNLPSFATYPSQLVQEFADAWAFRKVGLIVMDDINEVKEFLEKAAETGAHDGRDVEGFVIRCQRSYNPDSVPYQDFFFKFKFEEPYLMYRQWRECTKALISGKPPKFKKHQKITEEYLLYARKRLAADPKLAKQYMKNHGIITLRDDFLEFKHIKGADAANIENLAGEALPSTEVDKDVILVPIATIGCGKTTIAQALAHLFDWGHIQNDNLTGKGKKPPRFTRMCLEQLTIHPAVIADRNNAAKHERRQIITDVKLQHSGAKLVALHFVHDPEQLDNLREVTRARVLERGDNHQTIHAATEPTKYLHIMEGFIDRFEPCNPFSPPDDGFDHVIDLDPVAGSRVNLETVVTQLHQWYPNLVRELPSAEKLDEAIEFAMGYKPEIKHTIPDRGGKNKRGQQQQQQQEKKKPLEYMAVHVSARDVNDILEKAFADKDRDTTRFYMQLKQTRRVQPKFHVTLMHRASSKENPELWKKYNDLYEEAAKAGNAEGKLGDCDVMLERIVFDDRIMALVVRLVNNEWKCINKVAHITVGTRDSTVKPKESNDLLEKWLENGVGDKVHDVVLEDKPTLKGFVGGVANFFKR
ncbi:tRNA ligase 1 [Scedosporium apiospermum]|uniref:tRNA ligase n=1 Tax=Pseudallescheria apiosperma TaxID=563466 RepID=A0A084GHD2_PSEDA|nr:tRNA ligase 1 [Scedosporium apiospermum]KEZ46744.1 tRNA ligase 1 [Scedosporium apiospermum]